VIVWRKGNGIVVKVTALGALTKLL